MGKFVSRAMGGVAALSLLLGAAAVMAPGAHAQAAQKKVKDQGEYDIYTAVGADVKAQSWTKAIQDLDTWKQKYPDSDFKSEREVLYIQAYSGAGQFGKAIDTAAPLINGDLNATFSDPAGGPGQEITVLYTTVLAITRVQNPTPDQLAIGQKAATMLRDFDRKPGALSDADWADARNKQLIPPAKAALQYIAMLPGTQAMAKTPRDCVTAEMAFKKAMEQYPDNSAIAYNLGLADSCEKKYGEAIYEFERAVVVDPTLGGTSDAKKIAAFADGSYTKVHGSDEGLKELKDQVKSSPLPPPGFKIKTASEIDEEKRVAFEQSNPKLALWMKVKTALEDTNGEQYFTDSLKGTAVPTLRGTIVDAKPACRSKELLVAVPVPDAPTPLKAEIMLKLDAPLTGKPALNEEITWDGVPSEFVKDPFMLTMDTEKAKVEGLKLTPCAAAPGHTGKKK